MSVVVGSGTQSKPRRRWGLWTIPAIIFVVTLTMCLATFNGLIVGWRAEAIAGDRPYCIQAAGPNWDDFHPVRRLIDMSFWNMQGKGIPGAKSSIGAGQNHAVLVIGVDPSFLNWSYASENFEDEVLNRSIYQNARPNSLEARYAPTIVCKPIKHFVSTVSWF